MPRTGNHLAEGCPEVTVDGTVKSKIKGEVDDLHQVGYGAGQKEGLGGDGVGRYEAPEQIKQLAWEYQRHKQNGDDDKK